MIQILGRFLFSPNMPLWRYCLIAFPVALIPSVAISLIARTTFKLAGVNVDLITAPDRDLSMGEFVGLVLFAPLVETLLLSLLIVSLSSLSNRTILVAVVSGLFWGCVHATFGAMWFFGPAWSFFVFSCAYLHWRKESYSKGFLSAAIPHAMLNATAMALLAGLAGWPCWHGMTGVAYNSYASKPGPHTQRPRKNGVRAHICYAAGYPTPISLSALGTQVNIPKLGTNHPILGTNYRLH